MRGEVCGGWLVKLSLGLVSFLGGAVPGLGQIVINEFMQNPRLVNDDKGEWLELYNAGTQTVDINGWKLDDDDTLTGDHTIDNGGPLNIADGGYLVLGVNSDTATNGGVTVHYQWSGFVLGNSSDKIILLNASNAVQDQLAYDNGSTFPDGNGVAAALKSPDLDNSVGANWCEATTSYGDGDKGTPGAANDCPVQPPEPDPVTGEIFVIQGSERDSPHVNAMATTNDNIVTAVGAGGFFMQTPSARSDNDVNTSDGIFVVHSGSPTVAVGDQVDVVGKVLDGEGESDERSIWYFTRIDATVTGGSVTVDASNQTLPAPVEFSASRPSTDPAARSCTWEYECYEGMRVRVASGTVATGSQYFGSDPVAEMYVTATSSRPFREPGIEYPGEAGLPVWDGNPELFELDPDKLGLTNVSWDPGTTFAATGVLAYEWLGYELWPTELTLRTAGPSLPRAVRAKTAGEVSVASLNTLNLGQGGSTDPTALAKQSLYVRELMGAPDVIGVQEVHGLPALEELAARIESDDASATYTARVLAPGTSGQKVGFLVRSGVTINAVTEHGRSETFIDPRDGSVDTLHDRPPLVLDATVDELDFSVVVIHNRSLTDIDDPARGEWIRVKRLAQAQSVARLVQSLQNERLIVVGDYNAFQFTDGYVDVVGQISGNAVPSENMHSGDDLVDPDLTNLIHGLPAAERYSFLFEASAQALDHALVNQRMAPHAVEMQYARGNADAAGVNQNDGTNPLAASDHDGFVVYLSKTTAPPPPPGNSDLRMTVKSEVVSSNLARFTVQVTNKGPDRAPGVYVLGSLSADSSAPQVGSVRTSGCREDPGGESRCSLGDLGVGGSSSFTLELEVDASQDGSIHYDATALSGSTDPNSVNSTVEAVLRLGLPEAPSALTAAAISGTEVRLRWRDNSDNESGFAVFLQGPVDRRLREVGLVPANETSTVVGDLVPGVTYAFAVEARNGVLRSSPTRTATVTTWVDANLHIEGEGRIISERLVRYVVSVRNAGPDDASSVFVTSALMAEEGSPETSTSGCREDPGGLPECGLGYVEVGESDSFTIDVEIDAESPNSLTYGGAVRNVADPRPQESTAEVTLLLGRPQGPSHLEADAVSGTEVELRWRDNSDRETGFDVFLQGPGDSKLRLIGTAPTDTTSMVVNELVPSVTYSFAVEARNGELRSERTPKSAATTWVMDAARCDEGDTLCVGAFQVEVEWDDGKGRMGRGFGERLTADAGDFWFFHPANVELAVKVLDGCAINDHYWVYAAGLTDVGVTMTVRDLRSGVAKSWTNAIGTRFRPITDSEAFATCDKASSADSQNRVVMSGAPRDRTRDLYAAALSAADRIDSASSACAADDASLCLLGSRYEVRADWEAGGRNAAAAAIPRTADTGMFWFFSSDNVELVVKVLDGCRENGYRWVLMGGLTDVGVEVTVTDSESGRARMYRSLEGTPFPAMFDVTAFACDAGR